MARKHSETHSVSGRITNRQADPVAGQIVSAFVQGEKTPANPLSEPAATDADGHYRIDFTDEDLNVGGMAAGNQSVFIRVFAGEKLLGESPAERITKNQFTIDFQVQNVVDSDGPPRRVYGVVRDVGGDELPGITVRAFDRDLRHEEPLGESRTDKRGSYEIPYSPRQFRRLEKENADVVVKAFTDNGELLVASDVLFNAPPKSEINLTVPGEVLEPTTLFERIGRALIPLLGTVKFEQLEEDQRHQDVSFLAGETRFEKEVVARFAIAHKLAAQELAAEFWFVILGGSFFQYVESKSLAEQLSAVLKELPSLDERTVRKALTRGFNGKEITQSFRKYVDRWVMEFLQFVARLTVQDSEQPSFTRLALEHAGILEPKKQERFAALFNQHRSLTPELLATLENDPSFNKAEIADLSTSFKLADLTQGDFSVVTMLKEEFGIRHPDEIRKLAKRSEAEWVNLIKEQHASGRIKLPLEFSGLPEQIELPSAEFYGTSLERQFRNAFPTTAFTGGLERALQNGGARGLQHAETIGRFLNVHTNFEFLNTPLDAFLDKNVHQDFAEIAKNKDFRTELKATQRVFKLAATFEATDALLSDRVHSAQQIYRMGETEFVRRYSDRSGFTTTSARQAWNRAADTHAAVLTIVAELKALDHHDLPSVLNSGIKLASTFPNWQNLFRTGDVCECEHCRSVLSPAAYFADLLMFLKDRSAKDLKHSAKDILFGRRPDLGYLELNCDNALVTLPYIDVMCEVLEAAVDKEGNNDLELKDFTAISANPSAAKMAVAKALKEAMDDPANQKRQRIGLGENFSLSQVDPLDPNRWVVHGDNVTYLLKKKSSKNFFAQILRNTKASAAQLRAYPQYVNPKAYEKLREAKYPFTLPFDLFAEEVRAAFQKVNLQRWELMQMFRGGTAPTKPTDGQIAAEYFGISADPYAETDFDEMRLILGADLSDVRRQEVWGEKGNAGWLAEIANVKNFLQKTGLEYTELLALLDLKFINPSGSISIHHIDSSCDTEKKKISNLSATKLDRIHRFLRLWRKLKGWKMWELDLVIRHPQIGKNKLEEPFLIQLFYFARLKDRLGKSATVEHVCALLGDLNTETRFTKLHEKREDAFYQELFLNKRLINPLDPAFELDPATKDTRPIIDPATGLPVKDSAGLPKHHELLDQHPVTGSTVFEAVDHRPVILAALRIREADLDLLKDLTKSDGERYIKNELSRHNLSFLWRHAWLSKLLKLKPEEWKIVLKLLRQDDGQFGTPQAAWEFVESVEQLKATGFKPDELNWLLAADPAQAEARKTDAARFLIGLRKDLQAIRAEFDPEQYDFLTPQPPDEPTDETSLTALLTSLLQKLNRDEAAVNAFLKTLRGRFLLEASVQNLPPGFTFPATITGTPNNIPIRYEPVLRFSGSMTSAQRTILLTDPSLAAVTGLPGYQNAVEELHLGTAQAVVTNLPVDFAFPSAIVGTPHHIPIRYEPLLRFTGVMTDDQRITLLSAALPTTITNNPAYAIAIANLFQMSSDAELARLAVKFFVLDFTVPLDVLPAGVDFSSLPTDLAAKISYDAEQKILRFAGIMSDEEQSALKKLMLGTDPDRLEYDTAIDSLRDQPHNLVPPDERIWLAENDLDDTQPANDTLARLATAAKRALHYLSNTLMTNAVVQQCSAQLGLTEALTRRLLEYPRLPATLLTHLIGAADFTTMDSTFDGWFWAQRVAAIWNKWKITLDDLEKLVALTDGAKLLDFLRLPLNASPLPLNASPSAAEADCFVRTYRLLRLRDTLPETQSTLLKVLKSLNANTPATIQDLADSGFPENVEQVNEAWHVEDVRALIESLNLASPTEYLLAETWERLRRAFYFIDSLNAGADTVKVFADAAMNLEHARTIKELLRSKFGPETWQTLSAEIQDVLRERKRDALTAYLLAQGKPVDAPTEKWENTNELYAYYLLDVEMCSCQMTSRLVQGSGSVQLFVQRCFMGLEPNVEVKADGDDGDSAWRWWNWMRKYRVWEANRKVFLWPENWIEPELKKDRSPFFKDLENELLQNEVNQYTVETAFSNYLEKLDGVAQLEIAGFFQEDDGDIAIIHVFGRTKGVEPHLYYYRRFDYRQWTPWEKVELDIQGDYLVPAVVNGRLFLLWPVFTEVPDPEANSSVKMPALPGSSEGRFTPDKTKKRLRMQLAVSDYRQNKWTPKKVSIDFVESDAFDDEIIKNNYAFFALDESGAGRSFKIWFGGSSQIVGQATKEARDEVNKPKLDAAIVRIKDALKIRATAYDRQKAAVVRVTEATKFKTAILEVVNRLGDEMAEKVGLSRTKVTDDADSKLDDANTKLDNANDKLTQAEENLNAAWIEVSAAYKTLQGDGYPPAEFSGAFELTGCRGVPELIKDESNNIPKNFIYVDRPEIPSCGELAVFHKWVEMGIDPPRADYPDNDFTLVTGVASNQSTSILVLQKTPGLFEMTPPRQFSYFDKLWVEGQLLYGMGNDLTDIPKGIPIGSWLPFFYNDKKRTYFVLPACGGERSRGTKEFFDLFDGSVGEGDVRYFYYPEIKRTIRDKEEAYESEIEIQLKKFDLSSLTVERREELEQWLLHKFPDASPTDDTRVRQLMKRLAMRPFQGTLAGSSSGFLSLRKFHYKDFYHPFVCDFAKLVHNPLKGISALMSRETQLKNSGFSFRQNYLPYYYVLESTTEAFYPAEVVDFAPDGAYSSYNWELFFHIPLLIANSFSKNQRFEEARDWYHFIFNPIGVESPMTGSPPMTKYWVTKPFFQTTNAKYIQQRIDNILRMLAQDKSQPDEPKTELEQQVVDWRTNPFEPHRIANYRTVAYQKCVVMKYLDNLVAWGDYLFRQDSMESINEATQLYIMAAEILGPRPMKIPPQAKPPLESFNELETEFDKFSNALVEVENLIPRLSGNRPSGADPAPLPMLYFCIPQNDKMLEHWDIVADRLYKIRHCMNIEGVVRQLALFEPPIDPGALVKALAGGVDISSALADLNAPLPLYRFNVLLQKANEVCNDVKSLGGALLAALEKKDAEELGLLRQSHEIRVLEAVKTVREKQIEEAKENLDAAKKSKDLITIRRDYYQNIERISRSESLYQVKLHKALEAQQIAQVINIAASIAHFYPSVEIGTYGFGGSPAAAVMFGGPNVGAALQAAAGGFTFSANVENYNANKASINAGHERRWDDWKFQERLAIKELEQIEKTIAAAEIRFAIATQELENHLLQIENAKATDEFMRSKYTNKELYQWQVGQISGVYFQSYKLAYDLAKRAERCFRFELGLEDSSYISFGYWDSLKKGLLSGEKLQYDLRRLETAYLEQNRREFELTKHISLVLLDPLALVKLRETGRCYFNLPEEIFDLDFPGHYFRRIKSVSLTLPCVTGPYTTISCTLRLLKNSIRINTTNGDNGYPRNTDDNDLPADDERFIENNIPVKAIAASAAQNDSGVFELSFRDERYLPFEGAGAISQWSLELFSDLPSNNPDPGKPDFGKPLRQFDYGTISDAVLQVKYTAREDAGPFKNGVINNLRSYFGEGEKTSLRMFNLRQEFPTQWHRFLNGNDFELELSPNLFRMLDRDKTLKVSSIGLLARCSAAGNYSVVITPPQGVANTIKLAKRNEYGGLYYGEQEVNPAIELAGPVAEWKIEWKMPIDGKVSEVQDLLLLVTYK